MEGLAGHVVISAPVLECGSRGSDDGEASFPVRLFHRHHQLSVCHPASQDRVDQGTADPSTFLGDAIDLEA